MNATKILSQQAFWVLNKELAHKFGIEGALLIAELISTRDWLLTKAEVVDSITVEEGWFYETREQIEENTTLSPYRQREVIKLLLEAGVIETKEMGLPSKTYYRVFDDLLLKILTTVSEKTSQHIYKEQNNNNRYIDNPIVKTATELKYQLGDEVSPSLQQSLERKKALRDKRKTRFVDRGSFKPQPAKSTMGYNKPKKGVSVYGIDP